MTRLEKRLIRTFVNVQGMIYHPERTSDTEFMREYHHYIRLVHRYKKATGIDYTPIRNAESRRVEDKFKPYESGYGQWTFELNPDHRQHE
jgi:hypothetical protein